MTRPMLPPGRPGLLAATVLAIACAGALPASPAAAAPWAGDPDNPAQGPAPFEAGFSPTSLGGAPGGSILRRDLGRLASPTTLRLWVGGGALALAAHRDENPDKAEASLGHGLIDGPADLGNLYGSGVTLGSGALLLYAAGRITDDANLRGAAGEMARSLAYTTLIVGGMKVAVHRTRPNGGSHSFPSGHATAAFAVAPILAHRFGTKVAVPAYAIATATGLGRMEDRKHYLSDVIMGAAIGLSIGNAVAGPDAGARGPELGIGAQGVGLTFHF